MSPVGWELSYGLPPEDAELGAGLINELKFPEEGTPSGAPPSPAAFPGPHPKGGGGYEVSARSSASEKPRKSEEGGPPETLQVALLVPPLPRRRPGGCRERVGRNGSRLTVKANHMINDM